MFNCYNHGWSHIERECPKCFPAHTTTTASTTFIPPNAIVGINKSELDQLKAENERLQLELINLSVEHPCYQLSKQLEAENARYREALEKSCTCESEGLYAMPAGYVCPACEALKGGE